jgi:membrane-associated phospholipid phosphatase
VTQHTELAPRPAISLARVVTEILAPWVWVLGLPFAVAAQATRQLDATLLWGLVVGVTGSVIPMIVIVRGAKKGKWDSHHVTNREGRVVPFLACLISVAGGITILLIGDAPIQMTALSTSMFVSLIVSVILTFRLRWKVSMHAAVATGAVVVLMVTFVPWLAVAGLAVVLVAWSRIRLGDHTISEILGGVAVGALVGGLLYWALVSLLV